MPHSKETKANQPANTKEITKTQRDEKGRWIKGAPSPNPKGAPRRGQSWQETIRKITDMTKGELITHVGGKATRLGKILDELPDGIPVKDAMILIGIIQFGRDPAPGMLTALMDREEGKPRQPMDVSGSLSFEGLEQQLERTYGNKPTP